MNGPIQQEFDFAPAMHFITYFDAVSKYRTKYKALLERADRKNRLTQKTTVSLESERSVRAFVKRLFYQLETPIWNSDAIKLW